MSLAELLGPLPVRDYVKSRSWRPRRTPVNVKMISTLVVSPRSRSMKKEACH